MDNKAFVLTIEAILALLLAATIAMLPMQSEKTSLFELLLLQKQNDLLKIWLQQSELKESELVSDFNFVFPQLNGAIEIGEKKIEIKNSAFAQQNAVVSSAWFYSRNKGLIRLGIAVYN